MKKTLRITAVAVLALLLILTFASCGKKAAEDAFGEFDNGVDWKYTADTKTLKISGNGSIPDFDSPSEVPWASAKTSVVSLIIEDGIDSIGDYAFYSLTALEDAEIADSVESIGKSAFAFSSKIENIALPQTLKTIGDRAFEGCGALNTALVPASVESIGTYAFASCKSITVAAVLSDVEIPENTFFNCIAMEDLFLNPEITEDMVDATAFDGCSISFDEHTDKEGDTLSSTVTVKYLYEDGTEMEDERVSKSYEFGENYNIVSPDIEGYTAEDLSISGYADGHDIEKEITYTKNPEVTEVVEDEEEAEPFTNKDIIPIVILAVLLIGIAVAAVLIIRNQKKTEGASQTVRKNPQSNNNKKKK